jgi:hypothetical protein
MFKSKQTDAAVIDPVAAVETVAADQTVNLPATVAADVPTDDTTSEGVRARRAFMPKLFLPNKDWIMQNVVAKGTGSRAVIGRIYGQCFETKDKAGTLPNGQPSVTIALVGAFEAISYITGEVMSVSNAYMPMAFAEKVKAAFADETIKLVEVDCDIGLEATGKAIPYEWVTTAFIEGKEMAALRRMRTSRPRPAKLLLAPGESQLLLTTDK